jgi:hypothetical protein
MMWRNWWDNFGKVVGKWGFAHYGGLGLGCFAQFVSYPQKF